MPKRITRDFKTKKRFGLNEVNHIQKVKRKSKDTAVVFDENERHEFLAGIFNAKNKRKEFNEQKREEEENHEYRERNKIRREKKKENIEKYRHIIEDKGKEDKFLQDYAQKNIKTTVQQLKNSKNQSIIVKTSFLTT